MSGGHIFQHIDEYLTYDYLHSDEDNIWSILYLTGYLTQVKEEDVGSKLDDSKMTALTIPNKESNQVTSGSSKASPIQRISIIKLSIYELSDRMFSTSELS